MLSKCKETLENEVIWCSDILRGHVWPIPAVGMVIPLKPSSMHFKCISIGNWWFWITVARNSYFWDPQSWPIDLKPRIWAFHIELRRSWNFQINPMSRRKIKQLFHVVKQKSRKFSICNKILKKYSSLKKIVIIISVSFFDEMVWAKLFRVWNKKS